MQPRVFCLRFRLQFFPAAKFVFFTSLPFTCILSAYLSAMNEMVRPTTQLLGVGNPLRGDDGIGAFVCAEMDGQKLPGLVTRTVHQLDPALLEELAGFENLVIVDAAVNEAGVSFRRLPDDEAGAVSSSHHVNAQLLQTLAKMLYDRCPVFYLCAVGAVSFGMGEGLSPVAKKNAGEAVRTLTGWIMAGNR